MPQKKVRIYDAVTVILLIRYFTFNSVIFSLPGVLDKLLLFVGIFGYAWLIIRQRIKKADFVICALLSLIALYTSIQIRSWFILSTLLCIIATGRVHTSEFISLSKKVLSILLAMQALLSIALYIIGSTNYVYVILMGELRFMFGMTHPNVLAAVLVNIILTDIIEIYKNNTVNKNVLYLLKTLIAYYLTKSSGLIVILVLAIMLVNISRINKTVITKSIYVLAKYSPFVLMIGVLLVSKEYWKLGIDPLSYVNNFVIRLKEGAYLLSHEGMTIWGSNPESGVVAWTPEWRLNYVNVDNLYVMFMVTIGIGWFCIIEIGIMKLLKAKDNILISIFIIIWAAYGMTEVHAINIFLFFPLIMLGELFDINGREEIK